MDALAALRLQIEWGADEALLDEPVDRFVMPEPVATARPRAVVPRTAPAFRAMPAVPAASTGLAEAADLRALHDAMDRMACPLRATASHTVGPVGDPASGLLLIGEAPGPDDDRSGDAFSGPAGAAMDRVLDSAGLSRGAMMLAFMVPWRPPGGRKPSEGEIALCLPYIQRLLFLARPRRVVLMSGLALRALAGDGSGVRRARGKWTQVAVPGLEPIPALPMLPPDLWLSGPGPRSGTWADLMALRTALES